MSARKLPHAAIALSLAAHAAALSLLPGLSPQAEPPALTVTLRLPTPAPAQTSSTAKAPAELADKAPAKAPAKVQADAPRRPWPPVTRASAARPASAIATATANAPSIALASQPAAPAQAAPAPATAPAPADKPADAALASVPAPDSAALDDYGRALSDLLARQQQYPRLAALRGWEGEVRLRLKVARKGNLVAVQVVRSSGHEVLDQHAVLMVQSATLPSPPEGFGEREIQVDVPVRFRLQKST